MSTYRSSVRRRAPAAKLLLAACGLAGCTGGPAISSVSAEPPSNLARSEERALMAGDTAGRARIATVWPKLAARSIWGPSHKRSEEPVNPFETERVAQASSEEADPPGVPPAPATARVADGRVSPSPAGVRSPFQAIRAACGYPDGEGGTATARDHRLPPAPPLGSRRSSNTAQRAGTTPRAASARMSSATATEAPVDATPIRNASPVSRRKVAKPVQNATVPLDEFLVGGDRTRGVGPGRLQNEDMIVDSALLPKRSEWRGESAARAEDEPANFPITPRRPFTSPEWQAAGAAPAAASANLPVTLSPTEPIETEPVAVAKVMPAPAELSVPAAVGTSLTHQAEPEIENPFTVMTVPAVAEPIETAADTQQPVLAAGPLLAPGPPAAAPLMVPAEPAVTGPSLAVTTAAPEVPPARLAEATVTAEPVDLAEANRLAEREAVRPRAGLSTPLVVGLALAVVAIGAVMIRRRFG